MFGLYNIVSFVDGEETRKKQRLQSCSSSVFILLTVVLCLLQF